MNNYVNDIRIGHDQRKRLHITYSGEAPARHPYNSPTKQATIFFLFRNTWQCLVLLNVFSL